MPTPIRETALAAIAARLTSNTTATVERARRAPVDTDRETLPRLVLLGTEWIADETQEPLTTYYQMGFAVTGYVSARTDLLLEQALSDLHAEVLAALVGWNPSDAACVDVAEVDAEFTIYDAEDSAKPAGEFVARFTALVTAAHGDPYTA